MKRFIYLLSPEKIKGISFYNDLNKVLKTNKVKYFQLRLKKMSILDILKISEKVKKITKKNNVKLIINDYPLVAKMIDAIPFVVKNTKFILLKSFFLTKVC